MAANTTKTPKARVADDDVDDLDDVLDQFTPRTTAPPPPAAPIAPASKPTPATQPAGISSASSAIPTVPASAFPPPSPTPGSSFPQSTNEPTKADEEGAEEDEDFARELQRGMEALMRELVPGPPLGGAPAAATTGAAGTKEEIRAQEAAFKAAWEAMLVEGMDGMAPGAGGSSSAVPGATEFPGVGSSKPKDAAGKPKDFQAGIRAAVDKLKESESALKDSSSGSATPGGTDPLEALLSQLAGSLGVDPASLGEGLGAGLGDGEAGEEDLAGMLEQMMGSLMSKDVLYEPLKELSEKFPPYLVAHPELPAAERTRYEAQQTAITHILAVFEAAGYNEEDEKAKAEVVKLMSEMQSHGAPPTEIMGDLPPGFGLPGTGGEDGEGCCIA
ncbi:hypothetical protein HWV62_24930 [Athelia sp. TMB]|nr:hypothetical protein HWV62_24930 [Athelia sp. TMB]